MNRNDAYTFSVLGRNLERADMTSRIVDVRSAQLLPAETPELRPFESVQWMSVLKSLSGYQMYRLRMRTRVRRTDVLQFLLRDDQFPRSCQYCLMQLERLLHELPRSEGVLEVLSQAARFIERAPLATLDQPGLHELIDRLQLHINNVHNMIAGIYFPSHDASGIHRMPARRRASRSGRARCRSARALIRVSNATHVTSACCRRRPPPEPGWSSPALTGGEPHSGPLGI